MKKIYFGRGSDGRGTPFWQPWGLLGCLGRLLGFVLLLLLLLLLLSLFRKCGGDDDGDEIAASDDTVAEPSPDDPVGGRPVAEIPASEWRRPIEGGEDVGLPAPEDNVVPPFGEITPVPNPDDGGVTRIYPNLLYVILDSEADDETFKRFAEEFSSLYASPEHKITSYNTSTKTLLLEVPESTRATICRDLPGQITDIDFFVVPVELVASGASSASVTPDDPVFRDPGKSWYFAPIQAQEAWAVTQGAPDVIVGIVDSFMDLDHPELAGDRCIYPYSVQNANEDVAPPPGTDPANAGHGTLVTSIAVGNAGNREGSSGIAPKCSYIPVSMGRHLNTYTMVEGLLYCMYHNASVINISAGTMFSEEVAIMPLSEQIEYSEMYNLQQEAMWDYVFSLAEKHNTTIVWSAGNNACFSAMDESKRNRNTIVVSAVDTLLRRADFSNFGNIKERGLYESTISAPGVKIWGALPGNSYDAWDGTSFAAPIITGTVALLKSQNRDLTTQQIIKILQSTGKPVESELGIGNLVQIKDALAKAKEMVSSADAGS